MFETEREARECGGLGAQPPRKVRRVERLWCVVSFAEASLRLQGALWLFVACARTPFVLCTSPPRASPRREREQRRRVGLLWTPSAPTRRGRPSPGNRLGADAPDGLLRNFESTQLPQVLPILEQVLPLFTDGFGRLMAPRTRLDAKIGVSIQKNVPTPVPDPLSGLKVRESGIFSDFRS